MNADIKVVIENGSWSTVVLGPIIIYASINICPQHGALTEGPSTGTRKHLVPVENVLIPCARICKTKLIIIVLSL